MSVLLKLIVFWDVDPDHRQSEQIIYTRLYIDDTYSISHTDEVQLVLYRQEVLAPCLYLVTSGNSI